MKQERTHPLAVERLKRNLSQQMLADFTGMGRATIRRAERGEGISPQSRQRLCDYLGKTADQLGLVAEEHHTGGAPAHNQEPEAEHSISRRTMLRGMGAGAGAMAVGIAGLARRPTIFDTVALDNLEHIARSYWQLRASMRSADLLPGVIGQLDMMTQLAQTTVVGKAHARLVSIAGGLALVAGQLAFDITDLATARHFYRLGARAAEEANDSQMQAIAHTLQSLTLVEEGYADQAIVLLDRADQEASDQDINQVRGWISAIKAESYATLRQASQSDEALDIAQSYRIGSTNTADRYWSGFTESRLLGYQSASAVRLGQPERALKAIQASLNTLVVGDDRRRHRLLVDLANAHVHMGQVDEACAVATNALEGGIETDNRVVLERLRTFRTALEPWHSQPNVRAFTEQLLLA